MGSGPVTLHADGDRGGRSAALAASETIRSTGREAQITWYDGDPAELLAEWLTERAAVREHDGGETPDEANGGRLARSARKAEEEA